MWKKAIYRLNSTRPLMMHNVQLANPMNVWAKAIKKISSKRKKTDADYLEMARLEFFGGLYLDKDLGPIVEATALRAMIEAAARKRKEGPAARAGMAVEKPAKVLYDGPRTAKELWEYTDDPTTNPFADQRMVVVGRARVLRTRPIFDPWAAVVEVEYEDTLVDRSQLDEWMGIAGSICGLLEMRNLGLGKFTATVLDDGNGEVSEDVLSESELEFTTA